MSRFKKPNHIKIKFISRPSTSGTPAFGTLEFSSDEEENDQEDLEENDQENQEESDSEAEIISRSSNRKSPRASTQKRKYVLDLGENYGKSFVRNNDNLNKLFLVALLFQNSNDENIFLGILKNYF